MIDTPTNSFAVLNPLQGYSYSYYEGNLKCLTNDSTTSVGSVGACSIPMPSQGKWYSEYTITNINGAHVLIGIVDSEDTNAVSGSQRLYNLSTAYVMYSFDGAVFNSGVSASYGSPYGVGDILGVAYDADSGSLYFYINGVIQNSGTPAVTGLSGSKIFAFTDDRTANDVTFIANFGADSSFAGLKTRQNNTDARGKGDFYYAPPTGYLALCTDNLPAPAIEQPETHFNVVTYTGTGGTQAITGVGFQPDFVWIKGRSVAYNHLVFDSVRGVQKALHTNLTNATSTYTNALSSFDADGFTYGADGTGNQSGASYVAWCLKAGGTAVSNTDGSITSQVSANVNAGFSVVSYTGTGVDHATVGHGLNQAPDFYLLKRRDSVGEFGVLFDLDGFSFMYLNKTNAKGTAGQYAPTSTVIDTLAVFDNINSATYIAYCFHSVEGFSKFGSYVGNGSSIDPPFVYTGF